MKTISDHSAVVDIERYFRLSFEENEWRKQAACLGMQTDFFFLDVGNGWVEMDAIKTVCDACPVQHQCAEYAIKNSIQDGMWGGMTLTQRRRYGIKQGWLTPRKKDRERAQK